MQIQLQSKGRDVPLPSSLRALLGGEEKRIERLALKTCISKENAVSGLFLQFREKMVSKTI